jgi:hypothetical protein
MRIRELWREFKRALRTPLRRRPRDTAGGRILAASGEEVLLDEAEETAGTADATSFFTAVCGRGMKELLAEFGMTNIARAQDEEWRPGQRDPTHRFAEFRTTGYLLDQTPGRQIYIRPGQYPYHSDTGGVDVIGAGAGADTELMRPHATVVFTVREALSPYSRKRLTVHFHGSGKVRAKGYVWNRARPDRPKHYDGEEVRELISEQARGWARRIQWCGPMEKG